MNLNPKCEPQLGRRGAIQRHRGKDGGKMRELAMLWVLNLSDGTHSLLDIAEKSQLNFDLIYDAASNLSEHDLLKEI